MPFCDVGEGGELQWLCAPCNNYKSDKLQGYRDDEHPIIVDHNLRSLASTFSMDVYDRLIVSSECLPDFRGEECYLTNDQFDAIACKKDCRFSSIDCSLQYTTAAYTATHRWPQFSKLDYIEEWDGKLHVGAFLVTDFHGPRDTTWEGKKWYLEPWLDYHLNITGWVHKEDVTHMIRARFSFPANVFQPLIDELFTTMGRDIGKAVFVRFVGLWEIVSGKAPVDHHLSEDPIDTMHFLLTKASQLKGTDDKNFFMSKCSRPEMGDFYESFVQHESKPRTRLLLPLACQLRTYAALWVSTILREEFKLGADLLLLGQSYRERQQQLTAVYRDQIIWWDWLTDDGEVPRLIRLSKMIPDPAPPKSWWYKEQPVDGKKLTDMYCQNYGNHERHCKEPRPLPKNTRADVPHGMQQ